MDILSIIGVVLGLIAIIGGAILKGSSAGALVGSALANSYYYPYAYGPYPYAYGAPCAWRTVWNGYRWVRVCY